MYNVCHWYTCTCPPVWDVYEQVCVAAMDCADMETAEVHVDLVQSACSVARRLCVSTEIIVPPEGAVPRQCACAEAERNAAGGPREVSQSLQCCSAHCQCVVAVSGAGTAKLCSSMRRLCRPSPAVLCCGRGRWQCSRPPETQPKLLQSSMPSS